MVRLNPRFSAAISPCICGSHAGIYIEAMAEKMKVEALPSEDLQPIVYYCSRIKNPDSMKRKLLARGFPVTLESALRCVYDAVGIRIICSFANDVQGVEKRIENDSSMEILEKKTIFHTPSQTATGAFTSVFD